MQASRKAPPSRGAVAGVLVLCAGALLAAGPGMAGGTAADDIVSIDARIVVNERGPALPLPSPITDDQFRPMDPALADLGRLLFYDPILSGNRNIACGTCHHHDHASADGLSLPVGEGGTGIGPKREVGRGAARISERVARHSPALFNLGHRSVRNLFHDGRLAIDESEPSGFDHPLLAGRLHDLPPGLDGIVAAQAMFPVMAGTEMAGHQVENDVAREGRIAAPRVWSRIAARLSANDDYARLFAKAYPDIIEPDDITYVHVANALADFIETEWRSSDAPFDRWLRGEDALDDAQERGAALFYGKGGCAACHSGPLLTDQRFHSIALPQIGPGRTRQFSDGAFDHGRMNVTDDLRDAYRFRTPSLRNIAKTAPYGHDGAYSRLESIIGHHLDPAGALENYDPEEAVLPAHDDLTPLDLLTHGNERERRRIARSATIVPRALNDTEIADLVAFLHSLTDEKAVVGRLGKPKSVPSGLPVE